jgi:hypothetical protein
VDLSREMVLVSVLGPSSQLASSAQISSVEEKVCRIEVRVTVDSFPVGLDLAANPVDIVAVPRSLKEVVFIHQVLLNSLIQPGKRG